MAAFWVLLTIFGLSSAQYFDWDTITPLDEYVNRDDGFFELGDPIEVFNEDGADVYLFNMTSQKWVDEDYTDSSIWWHHFAVAIPTDPQILDAAHLFVEGGNNGDDGDHPDMGTGRMRYIADFAREVGAVAALLRQNPNQPVFFADSPNVPRTEDMIIARTWRHYIEDESDEPDPEIILQLPMTKAAKVAVDALIDFSASINSDFEIDKIMPSGFSKRGWVAWLLACVDPRVFATAPIVLDILNWHENLHHHYQAYGGWSWAFSPYWNENVSMYIDHPRAAEIGDELAADPIRKKERNLHHHYQAYGGWSWAFSPYWAEDVSAYIDHPRAFEVFDDVAIDPIRYNVRLDGMPKLVSTATGDQFFLPDDSHYYFDELTSPKYLSIFENTDHGMGGHGDRLWDNLMHFFVAAYSDFEWPEVSWDRIESENDGTIRVATDDSLLSIRAFWTDTTNVTCQPERNLTGQPEVCRRDFRQRTLNSDNPIWWEEIPVEDEGDGVYSVTFDKREDEGYRGMLIQMTYPGVREGDTLDLTTEVHIIEDTFPFERCSSPEECRGVLK